MKSIKTNEKFNKNARFNSEIKITEKINPLFSSARIRVLYKGQNRNGTYLSKESVEQSLGSIYNIPLVGEFIEKNNNFGDHAVDIEIKDDQMKLVSRTIPYGIIPESAKVYWEDVEELDGTMNEYLIVDGALLWTGRYEELNLLLEKPFNQSMEIEIVNGSYAIIDSQETFNIEEFLFSALCILGTSSDEDINVEPAFESASITTYSLDKENFKNEFSKMIEEMNFSIKEGGQQNMSKEVEQTEKVADATETVEVIEENFENKVEDEKAVETIVEAKEVEVQQDFVETLEQVTKERDELLEKVRNLEEEVKNLSEERDTLRDEIQDVREADKERERMELAEQFSDKLTEDEIKSVFEASLDLQTSDIEDKLFALVGKKLSQEKFSLKEKATTKTSGVVIPKAKDIEASPYGNIFD